MGMYFYNAQVARGKPFIQGGIHGGEFDYVKLDNREFTLYLTELNLHDRAMLSCFGEYEYMEFDVLVVIDGIKYERFMFCYMEETSELEVENITIKVSFYMEENIFTPDMLFLVGMSAIATTLGVSAIFACASDRVKGRRRTGATAEIQETT